MVGWGRLGRRFSSRRRDVWRLGGGGSAARDDGGRGGGAELRGGKAGG